MVLGYTGKEYPPCPVATVSVGTDKDGVVHQRDCHDEPMEENCKNIVNNYWMWIE